MIYIMTGIIGYFTKLYNNDYQGYRNFNNLFHLYFRLLEELWVNLSTSIKLKLTFIVFDKDPSYI